MITIDIRYPNEPRAVRWSGPAVGAMAIVASALRLADLQEVSRIQVHVTGAPTAAASRRPMTDD